MRYSIFLILIVVSSCSNENSNVFIQPSEVYIAGLTETDGRIGAAYWKNGKLHLLPGGLTYSIASNIAVAGTDVYVAGVISDRDAEDDQSVNNVPVLWKNGFGSLLPIPDSVESYYRIGILSLDVVDGDVYVFGQVSDQLMNNPGINVSPVLWKNGQLVPLDNLAGRGAGSLNIVGEDIFIAVDDGYWKNGIFHTIEEANVVALIEVVDDVVYAAGLDNNFNRGYWSNGLNFVPLELPNQETYGLYLIDIKLLDGDVYILGRQNDEAILWKNGLIEAVIGDAEPSDLSTYENTISISGNKRDKKDDYYGVYWLVNGSVKTKPISDCSFASSIFTR